MRKRQDADSDVSSTVLYILSSRHRGKDEEATQMQRNLECINIAWRGKDDRDRWADKTSNKECCLINATKRDGSTVVESPFMKRYTSVVNVLLVLATRRAVR